VAIPLVAGTLRLLRFARNDNMDIMHRPMRASAPTRLCTCFHINYHGLPATTNDENRNYDNGNLVHQLSSM